MYVISSKYKTVETAVQAVQIGSAVDRRSHLACVSSTRLRAWPASASVFDVDRRDCINICHKCRQSTCSEATSTDALRSRRCDSWGHAFLTQLWRFGSWVGWWSTVAQWDCRRV